MRKTLKLKASKRATKGKLVKKPLPLEDAPFFKKKMAEGEKILSVTSLPTVSDRR